jgi:hypothetical protein
MAKPEKSHSLHLVMQHSAQYVSLVTKYGQKPLEIQGAVCLVVEV